MSHDLVEPSPAILMLLANKAYDSLKKWEKEEVIAHVKSRYGKDIDRDEQVRVEYFLPAILYIYDAMIDWMGPGGDHCFLELYVFANQSLPQFDFFANSYEYMKSSDRRSRDKVKEEFGNYRIPWPVMAPCIEAVNNGDRGFVRIIARPATNYRQELMGELAEPWPVNGEEGWQPYYYFRPRRHVLPLERPYDETGYMP